jgi:hypothetical protein
MNCIICDQNAIVGYGYRGYQNVEIIDHVTLCSEVCLEDPLGDVVKAPVKVGKG